ncbi:BRO family protein [Clostridium sp. WILCCON 0269]|uniref:BRO family protein n=1 Tax=Candidatus Clostridium eludens TaxID=3381663 RepID=A0ABW8SR44_9CLOT
MNKLIFLQSDNFGNTKCDFYRNIQDDILMTRIQVGEALEYAYPQESIQKLHERHKERLDKFSVQVKLTGTDDKLYMTYLHNPKGVYEICRWSHQPKADDFMDWVWDVIEKIRKMDKNNLEHLIKREAGKITRKALTDAIEKLPDRPNKKFKYKQFTDLIYKIVFNKNARQLREKFSITKNDDLRNCFTTNELEEVKNIEGEISIFIGYGYSYQDIKDLLTKKYTAQISA